MSAFSILFFTTFAICAWGLFNFLESRSGITSKTTIANHAFGSLYYQVGTESEPWMLRLYENGDLVRRDPQILVKNFTVKDGSIRITRDKGEGLVFPVNANQFVVLTEVRAPDDDFIDEDFALSRITVKNGDLSLSWVVDDEDPNIDDNIFFGTTEDGYGITIVAGAGVTLSAEPASLSPAL